MPNPGLMKVLTTERSTPVVARWLCGLLERLDPPERSLERQVRDQALAGLNLSLQSYKEHRRKDDPLRSASHRSLVETTVVYLQKAKVLAGNATVLPPAMTEESLERALSRLQDLHRWHYPCDHCGRQTLTTNTVVCKGHQCQYCNECLEAMTVACLCGERHHRDDIPDRFWVYDNRSGSEKVMCDQSRQATTGCTLCGVNFVGPPGRHESISLSELTALGHCLCGRCAERLRKYDCGHIDTGGVNSLEIEHVEDDDRERTRIESPHKVICRACSRARPRLNFWNASHLLKATSFTEVGSQRRYGIELEVCQVSDLSHPPSVLTNYWHCKADASLPNCGAEFASVILQGDEGLEVVRELCEYARSDEFSAVRGPKWSVDARSGFHLHVEMPDNWTEIKSIAVGYLATYDLWRSFAAPSRGKCKYCRQHSLTVPQALKLGGVALINRLSSESDSETERRRRWCNWCCHERYGTVEIRLHQGTLVAEKVVRWVQAHTRFIDWCASQTAEEVAQQLSGGVRSQFLKLSVGPWGRELGRWLKQRALLLHKGRGPLQQTKSITRNSSGTYITHAGLVVRVVINERGLGIWYILLDSPNHGSGFYLRADGDFAHSSVFPFHSEEEALSVARALTNSKEGAVSLMAEIRDRREQPARPVQRPFTISSTSTW